MLDTRSGSGICQRDMYHILAPKCHGQDSAVQGEYHPPSHVAWTTSSNAPRLIELAPAVTAEEVRQKTTAHYTE